ncbi:MAG: adenylate/guanylate cyclase domain-containing protein, partial [Chloroflexota bacterium]|nr:adenylate/guanylate cyclase domain-containing protein [Chloroflexota bacterium]
ELGDRRWSDVLDAHNARVRAALAAFRGREVKTTGDGFLALFDAPAAAIRCARAIVRTVRPLGLEVRVGVHAGEYDVVGGDVGGLAISYGSWVMSKAGAGEVMVSDTVKGLLAGSDIEFVDRGAHRVKGRRERRRLFAVEQRRGIDPVVHRR